MYHFCTLFDTNYLSRGLVMYRTLAKYCADFHLYIFAFDETTESILNTLALPHVTVIGLREFEDEQLLAVKSGRSKAEYCWTCTSSTILYVLDRYKVDHCTYIDADLYFCSSPKPIFEELGSKSILITEHRFSPQYASDSINGRFCVQFVFFRNDERGRKALTWWREKCIDWCYDHYDNGRFGDQGYLNDWESRFEGVHVLRHLGGGVAPWNVQQYIIFSESGKLFGTELERGRDFELIFYHFHYLRFHAGDKIEFGRRELTKSVLKLLYQPYLRELEDARADILKINPGIEPHGIRPVKKTWKSPIVYVIRKLKGVYHIYDKKQFLNTAL